MYISVHVYTYNLATFHSSPHANTTATGTCVSMESKTLNYELEQNDFLRPSFGIDAKMCGIADNNTTLAN